MFYFPEESFNSSSDISQHSDDGGDRCVLLGQWSNFASLKEKFSKALALLNSLQKKMLVKDQLCSCVGRVFYKNALVLVL